MITPHQQQYLLTVKDLKRRLPVADFKLAKKKNLKIKKKGPRSTVCRIIIIIQQRRGQGEKSTPASSTALLLWSHWRKILPPRAGLSSLTLLLCLREGKAGKEKVCLKTDNKLQSSALILPLGGLTLQQKPRQADYPKMFWYISPFYLLYSL